MQYWITGLIVAYAFWVVARRYMPAVLRRALRSWTVKTAQRFGWHGIAARMSAAQDSGGSCGDGCGSCGSCGSDETASSKYGEHVIKFKATK